VAARAGRCGLSTQEQVKREGITLAQAACLARCNGARVELFPHGAASLGEFRALVVEAAASGAHHLIVSYSRRHMGQTGDGHFSPVGGYEATKDMVLILDTARFKYPPHWVPLPLLYDAMAHLDPATGRPRGFMRLGLQPRLDSVLFTLDLRHPGWREAFRYVEEGVGAAAAAAAAAPGATAAGVVAAAAAGAPAAAVRRFVAVRTAGGGCSSGVCTQEAAVNTFLQELRGMPLFAAVQQGLADAAAAAGGAAAAAAAAADGAVESAAADGGAAPAAAGDLLAEQLCMLLMLAPAAAWGALRPAALRRGVLALLDQPPAAEAAAACTVVAIEAEYLRAQLREVPAMRAAMDACGSAACADAGAHVCGAGGGGGGGGGDGRLGAHAHA
jgi:hypothetical protein